MAGPGLLAATADPWVRWDWIDRHWSLILSATRQHLVLTGLAVGIGLLLSAPMALAARRWRRLEAPILGFTGVVYTIPSLALFAFLVPWTGLTVTTAEVGLVGYTLLILVRNILTGLDWFTAAGHWQGPNGIPHRALEHTLMSGGAVLVALAVALPVGVGLGHVGRGGAAAINVSNLGRALPSFGILVLFAQLFGLRG